MMKLNIRFEETTDKTLLARKTKTFYIYSNHSNDFLGKIYFLGRWRCYVFEPTNNTIYSCDCQREIADFTENLTKEWRESLKLKKTIVTEHNMNDVVFTKEELIKKIETNKNKIIILDEYYILDDDNEKQKNRMSEEMAERFESLNNNRRVI